MPYHNQSVGSAPEPPGGGYTLDSAPGRVSVHCSACLLSLIDLFVLRRDFIVRRIAADRDEVKSDDVIGQQ